MRKKSKKPQPARKAKAAPKPKASVDGPDAGRRRFLRLARNGAIALPLLAGAGWLGTRAVQATVAEADLSRIGQGIPSVVQIHDPGCALCRALQGQTRDVLKAYTDEQVTYLVADVNTQPGRLMAATHNVPHVTLLLFDGAGQMVQVVRGPTDETTVEAAIATLIDGAG